MKIWGIFLLLLGNAAALWAIDTQVYNDILLPNTLDVAGSMNLGKYAIVGLLFSFINTVLRPILNLVSIPFRFLTMGLFGFILNAVMLFAVQVAVDFLAIGDLRLIISGLLTYVVAGLLLSIANHILHWFV